MYYRYKAWCLLLCYKYGAYIEAMVSPDSPPILIWNQVFLVPTYTVNQSPTWRLCIMKNLCFMSSLKQKPCISKSIYKTNETTFYVRALVQRYPTDRRPLTRDDHQSWFCTTTIRLWLASILFQQKVFRRSFGMDPEWAFQSITPAISSYLSPQLFYLHF